ISEHDNSLDLRLAAEVAPFFRLTNEKATEIIQHTTNIVSQWQKIATKNNISREEQAQMSAAFKTSPSII
ncbi:MAG: type II toxin-antitoxin system HipA family toxin, partial [Bacteroidales bacterium]|nr:type II toxin-antitoxin system HipA family toxin [Bacteroidales bacterium]